MSNHIVDILSTGMLDVDVSEFMLEVFLISTGCNGCKGFASFSFLEVVDRSIGWKISVDTFSSSNKLLSGNLNECFFN